MTVWELLTSASCRPYDWLSNDQLVDTLTRWRGGHLSLTDPPARATGGECPRELADLLRQCWNADDDRRPTFADINVFLTVKSAGFCPPPAPEHD